MQTFTDYLGNPVTPGSLIVYPTATGSSSANLNLARVEAIDDIVPDLRRPGTFCFRSMHNKREHASVSMPKRTVTNPVTGELEQVDDTEKAYQVKIRKLREGQREYGSLGWENPERLFTIRNVDRIVVVTDLTVIR